MVKRYLPWFLLVLHCGLIFWFSAQPAGDSSKMSQGILMKILSMTPVFKQTDVSVISQAEHVLRKCAHFGLYLLLGVYAYFSADTLPVRKKLVWALLFCLLYAASDEWHQSFSPGRSPELKDILLDFCGSLCGAVSVVVLKERYLRRNLK